MVGAVISHGEKVRDFVKHPVNNGDLAPGPKDAFTARMDRLQTDLQTQKLAFDGKADGQARQAAMSRALLHVPILAYPFAANPVDRLIYRASAMYHDFRAERATRKADQIEGQLQRVADARRTGGVSLNCAAYVGCGAFAPYLALTSPVPTWGPNIVTAESAKTPAAVGPYAATSAPKAFFNGDDTTLDT